MFEVISIHEIKPLLPNCVRPSFRTISTVRICLYVCLYIRKPIQLICNSCWKWRRVFAILCTVFHPGLRWFISKIRKSPKTAFDLRQLILLFVFGSTTVAYLEKYIFKTWSKSIRNHLSRLNLRKIKESVKTDAFFTKHVDQTFFTLRYIHFPRVKPYPSVHR